jgi:Na+/proline symporter
MIAMLAGLYFFNKKQNSRRFYVSGRNMSSWHIGLSVVATDVGGGFQLARTWIYYGFLVHGCYSRDYWRLVECRLPYSKG